ncbi:MAG TPA: MauE/DoxX family redox-associated membrane protein [Tepidisphaeraceae bacterium]|jgi:hypothetical protein
MQDAFGTRLLRTIATVLLALVFVAAGASKMLRTSDEVTMLTRFIDNPQAIKGLGCLEVGLGLWLLSLRTPRLTGALTAAALVLFTAAIGWELTYDRPLPCGCATLVTPDSADVRRDLWLAIGRNSVLLLLAGVMIVLAPVPDET